MERVFGVMVQNLAAEGDDIQEPTAAVRIPLLHFATLKAYQAKAVLVLAAEALQA